MKILFRNARILKMNDEDIFIGDLITDGNRITYVGKSKEHRESFDRVIECNGNLLMPGFKNCHTHSAMTFLRSYADDLPLDTWLFDKCIPAEQHLTPSDIYHLSKVAILEYLTSGITACFDMYFYPHSFIKACHDLNFRGCICLMKTSYYSEEQLSEIYESTFNDRLVTAIPCLHAEYTSNLEDIRFMKKFLYKYKAPFFTHVSETAKEVNECLARWKMTPTELFDKYGLYDFGGGGFHGVWFVDKDFEIYKEKNLSMVLNLGSNSKLASGIPDVVRYLDEGINLAIGTDGPASNNCLDMFKEMHLISSLSKIKNNSAAAVPADEILKMATVNGSKCLNLMDTTTLEEGKLADLIMIDLDRPSMRPLINIKKNIVYSGSKDIVKLTMINGKILYEDGKFFVGEDINEIYEAAQKVTDRIMKEISDEQ